MLHCFLMFLLILHVTVPYVYVASTCIVNTVMVSRNFILRVMSKMTRNTQLCKRTYFAAALKLELQAYPSARQKKKQFLAFIYLIKHEICNN